MAAWDGHLDAIALRELFLKFEGLGDQQMRQIGEG
jgi:hypothetical protein